MDGGGGGVSRKLSRYNLLVKTHLNIYFNFPLYSLDLFLKHILKVGKKYLIIVIKTHYLIYSCRNRSSVHGNKDIFCQIYLMFIINAMHERLIFVHSQNAKNIFKIGIF